MFTAQWAQGTEKAIYINRTLRPLSDILGCRIDADPTSDVPRSVWPGRYRRRRRGNCPVAVGRQRSIDGRWRRGHLPSGQAVDDDKLLPLGVGRASDAIDRRESVLSQLMNRCLTSPTCNYKTSTLSLSLSLSRSVYHRQLHSFFFCANWQPATTNHRLSRQRRTRYVALVSCNCTSVCVIWDILTLTFDLLT